LIYYYYYYYYLVVVVVVAAAAAAAVVAVVVVVVVVLQPELIQFSCFLFVLVFGILLLRVTGFLDFVYLLLIMLLALDL
jgi:hypothetical protein